MYGLTDYQIQYSAFSDYQTHFMYLFILNQATD